MDRGLSSFIEDTRAVDTIPLKMVVYLAVTGAIMVLVAISWSNAAPFIQGVVEEEQISDAALDIASIQNGPSRDLTDIRAQDGSMCIIELSLPDEISYVAFGVDPDPNRNADLTDNQWINRNNTIVYQYNNGAKKYATIKGDPIHFRQGIQNYEGIWVIDSDKKSVVIEGPIDGEFVFELVSDGGTYTMSHF